MYAKPLRNTLIIRPAEVEKVLASGIVLPGSVESEWTRRAEVLATGPGVNTRKDKIPMQAKVGTTILFQAGEGYETGVKQDLTLPETYVLATVQDDGTLKPHWDKILVRLVVEEQTVGRVLIPDSVEHGYDHGVVIAVGDGLPHGEVMQTPDVQAGDRVLFSCLQGVELEADIHNPHREFIVRESAIHAVLQS